MRAPERGSDNWQERGESGRDREGETVGESESRRER